MLTMTVEVPNGAGVQGYALAPQWTRQATMSSVTTGRSKGPLQDTARLGLWPSSSRHVVAGADG
jgi:hypothetical protein